MYTKIIQNFTNVHKNDKLIKDVTDVYWLADNVSLFSYDARKLSQSGGSHWSDLAYSGRVSFILSPGNTASLLTLRHLREEDHGVYRYGGGFWEERKA